MANEILVFSSFSQDQLIKLFGRSSQVYRFGAKNKYLEPRSKDIDVIVFGRMLEYQGVKRLPAICRYLDDLKIVLASKSLDPSDFDGLNCTVIPEFIAPEMLDDLVLRSKVVMMPYESATQSGHVPYSISRFCIPVVTAVGALPEQVQTFNSVIFYDKEFSAEKYAELVRLNVNKDRPDSLFYQWLEYQKNSNMLLSEYISKDFLNG